MPEVDFESAWFELKAHVSSKRSHGADELKIKMADLEVGFRVPEGERGFDLRPALPPRERTDRSATAAPAIAGRGSGDG